MTGVFLPHWQFNDWTVVGWDGVAILHLHQPVSTNINTDNFSFITDTSFHVFVWFVSVEQ